MAMVMRASPSQRSRVGIEEGIRLQAYQDTVGVWTIGKGHAATNPIPVRGMLNGKYYEGPPKLGVTITPQEVDRLFDLDMDETERGISALVTADLTQGQFDALCDFVHQYGMGRFAGSTLLQRINFNPNNLGATEESKGVLYEFMRWTQAGGEHQEYVWRRSARRCCIYTGTLIPQRLWKKASTAQEKTDGYPFALIYDDGWKIDYSITPTIDQILADGRRLAKPPEVDLSKNWQDMPGVAIKPNATVTVITDTPAAPAPVPVPEAKGGAVPAPPNPAGAVLAPSETPAAPVPKSPVSAAGKAEPQAPPAAAPPPSPKPAPPPVIAGVDGVKPKSPNTVPPSDVPYKIDPNAGLKPIDESDRVKGYVIQQVGIGVIRLGSLGVFGTTVQAGAQTVQGDPVLSNLILMGFVAGGIALVGYVIKVYGDWKRKRGEAKAGQALY